jgi:hypothetical protein
LSNTKNGFNSKIEFKDYTSSNESIGIERDELYSEINSSMIELLKVDNPFYIEAKTKQNKLNDEQDSNRKNQVDDENMDEEELDFEEFDVDETETSSLNEMNIYNNKSKLANGLENPDSMPIITNTTLNIIRLFGKYIHMLSIFKIISSEVISYLMQLFNFYLYYIYLHFAYDEVNCFLYSLKTSKSNSIFMKKS